MSIFNFLRRKEKRGLPVTKSLEDAILAVTQSSAGVAVTANTAMSYSAVYACVRVLAETIASLPLNVYERLDNGGKQKAFNHQLYPILHNIANPELTSFEWREISMLHLGLRGNAYSEIILDGAGDVKELWPLRPDYMAIKRYNGQLVYSYNSPTNGLIVFPADRILHIKGLSNDGMYGLSPLDYFRNAVGLGLAAEEYGARFFSNDAKPGGILEHPNTLSEEAINHLKKSWEANYRGLSNKHRVAILEEGMKFHEIGVSPESAQFLETRKFQVNEIARIFRIPPHMIGDLERSTFSNIEQQSIEFVIHTIRPWLVRWEQVMNQKLLSPAERRKYFIEFLVDGLLRGDIKSRYEAYAVGRQNGWLSADDIRAFENLNPLPNDEGKIYLVPLNMVPANSLVSPKPKETKSMELRSHRAAESRRRIAESFMNLFEATETKITKREIAEIQKAIKKYLLRRDSTDFEGWLDNFYEGQKEYMQKNWLPIYVTMRQSVKNAIANELNMEPDKLYDSEEFLTAYIASHVNYQANSNLGQIKKILRESESPADGISVRLKEWEEKRPHKIALRETVQFSNAQARESYRSAGVRKLQWVANGSESCPYCNSLDGRIVGIDEVFLSGGTHFHPEGAEEALPINTNIYHPPAHEGCTCQITAAV